MGWIGSEKQAELPYETLEQEMLDPFRGIELTPVGAFVASLLLEASSEVPIRIDEIAIAVLHSLTVTLTDRKVKEIIRGLRRDHCFPICSRKGKPPGYWWGRTESELAEFVRVWQSQYLDEAQTLSRMIKANYPRLAGQLKLALEE